MATQVTLNSGAVSSAGSLKLQTNGTTDAVTIDTAQNMGLGVTPSAWGASWKAMQVQRASFMSLNSTYAMMSQNFYSDGTNDKYIATDYATRYYQNSGQHVWQTAVSGSAGTNITFTQAMTLDASGKLGIGTSSPVDVLTVSNGSIASSIAGSGAGLQMGRIAMYSTALGGGYVTYGGEIRSYSGAGIDVSDLRFYTANGAATTERARIDSSGNLLVGTTTTNLNSANGLTVQPSGNAAGVPYVNCSGPSTNSSHTTWGVYQNSTGAWQFYVDYGGTIHARSTSISSLSDQREKENIRVLETGLQEVMALQPRRFDWINGSKQNVAGFIAQEVKQILPDLIDSYKHDEEDRFGLRMGDMIPTLVKAIQEQQAMIASQSELITSLTERITALENK